MSARADDFLLDVGSTSIKYVYGGETGSVPFPAPDIDRDGRHETDARRILDAVYNAWKDARPARLFISVQMHGYLLNDGPFVSWKDRRGAGVRRPNGFDGYERGTAWKDNLPLAKLTADGPTAGTFYTLGSYLAHALTGVNATHITDAAASGLFYADGRPCGDLPLTLPVATTRICPIGRWQETVVYTPVGDQQVSFAGSLVNDDQYLLNASTATQICTLTDGHYDSCECRPYFDGRRLATVSGLTGGDEIRRRQNDKAFIAAVSDQFAAAVARLPAKRSVKASGGAVLHFPAFFKRVLANVGLPFELADCVSAAAGLSLLAAQTD